MSFAAAAERLRQQEIARLRQYVTPPVEAMRSLTPGPFRERIAEMLERLGHEVVNNPSAPELITIKNGEKHIIMCSTPSDPHPTGTRDVARLHDIVIAANAQRGIYITTRTFTPDAQDYARTAPINLVAGKGLAKALERSKADAPIPSTYKAICQGCGDIVQHSLDKGDALPCINGHMVPPTIARAAIDPHPHPQQPDAPGTKLEWRSMTAKAQRRRATKAHNHKVRERAIERQQNGDQ
jgi:hypothetical protein